MCKFHVWPCDTTCADEDLEDMLSFMSDDYLTYTDCGDGSDHEHTYNEVATLLSL
jgi:hypothetical protein